MLCVSLDLDTLVIICELNIELYPPKYLHVFTGPHRIEEAGSANTLAVIKWFDILLLSIVPPKKTPFAVLSSCRHSLVLTVYVTAMLPACYFGVKSRHRLPLASCVLSPLHLVI